MKYLSIIAALAVLWGSAQAGVITSEIEVSGDFPDYVYGTGTVTFDDTPIGFEPWCGCDIQGYQISSITFEVNGETYDLGGGVLYEPYSYYLGVDSSLVLAINGNFDFDASWEFWDYFANSGFYINYYRLLETAETPLPAAAWLFLAGLFGLGQRLRSMPTIK